MDLETRLRSLEEYVYWQSNLIYRAFGVAGMHGDYIEFGVLGGATLSIACRSVQRWRDLMGAGAWDFNAADPEESRVRALEQARGLRFIGFDSFVGLPVPSGIDAEEEHFVAGTYAVSRETTLEALRKDGIDETQVRLVEGALATTCVAATASEIGLREIAVLHINAKLHASSATALEFCSPYLRERSVIVFSDWYEFGGNPDRGSPLAFREWQERHPEWLAVLLDRERSSRIAFVLARRQVIVAAPAPQAARPSGFWQRLKGAGEDR